MAFGLSEREHGADIYNTDMVLTPADGHDEDGVVFRASGESSTPAQQEWALTAVRKPETDAHASTASGST
jgi:hypothetical protein